MNKMLAIAITAASFLSLCSFKKNECKNENISLQNITITTLNTQNSPENSSAFFTTGEDELDKIYDDFISSMPEDIPKTREEIKGFLGIKEVFGRIFTSLGASENTKGIALMIAIAMLLALVELFVSESELCDASRSAILVILSVPVLNIMLQLVKDTYSALVLGSEIFSGIIPAVSGLLAVGSGGSSAALSGAGMNASLGFVNGALANNLLPLSAMIFSASAVSSFDTDGITEGVAKGIRGIFNFLIGLSSVVITAVVGMQTAVSVSVDNLALKSARYAVSGMIPVVGGAVSGALSTLIAGVKLLSSSVGAVSLAALLSALGLPLLRLLFYRFALFLCITVSSFSGGSLGARLFTSVRGALDTVIAVLASSALVYVLEAVILTSCIRGAL